jgi:phosphinothricin acetyltransferase
MSLQIRPVRETDFAAIAALTNRYILATHVHFGMKPTTPEDHRSGYEKLSATHPYLVGEEQGVFAGYAKAYVWREREAYSKTCEVGIYVEDKFQGRGVGRSLYSALLDELARRGFHSAIGGIALPNAASIRLHESLGFVGVGTVRDAGRKFDRWHDVAFYQKMLGEPTARTP